MRAGATRLHERRCRVELTLLVRMHRIARTVEIVIPERSGVHSRATGGMRWRLDKLRRSKRSPDERSDIRGQFPGAQSRMSLRSCGLGAAR
jgi:hypothetical protein